MKVRSIFPILIFKATLSIASELVIMQVKLVLFFCSLLVFTLAYRPRPPVHPRSKVTQLEIDFEGSALHKHTAFLPLSCIPQCEDGNEPLAFMTYDDKCPKILTEENQKEAEIAVEDYCRFAKDESTNMRRVDNNNVCQYCRSKANHQWHRIQAEYVGIKHFIYPEESDHCMGNKKFHLKVMKEGKCEEYPEDGRDGREIGISRVVNNRAMNRAMKEYISKREREREMIRRTSL